VIAAVSPAVAAAGMLLLLIGVPAVAILAFKDRKRSCRARV
jgi:hypothetical protein